MQDEGDRMGNSTDTGVNNGTSGHTPKPTSEDSYHSICNTVSFSEEDMKTDTVTSKALTSANHTSQKATTLQRRMHQLRIELESVQQSQQKVKPLPHLTPWTRIEYLTAMKGDKSRRSTSISRQRMEMRISHHRKKGIAGSYQQHHQ